MFGAASNSLRSGNRESAVYGGPPKYASKTKYGYPPFPVPMGSSGQAVPQGLSQANQGMMMPASQFSGHFGAGNRYGIPPVPVAMSSHSLAQSLSGQGMSAAQFFAN